MTLSPGFTSLHEAQGCFRAVLAALSRPGLVQRTPALMPPAPLSPAAAAILLTLTDASVALALLEPNVEVQAWLTFHTGVRFAALANADFVMGKTAARPALSHLQQGSYDEPENGATLILDVPALGTGRRTRLTGPGIESEIFVNVPLDDGFFAERAALYANAPCGVDILLCSGNELLGLPRSTLIEVA